MNNDRESKAAFTLTELLVVLGVVFLLAALALPAMSASRTQSKIAQCASNLRLFGLAMHVYGGDNNDRVPQNVSGSWAWDMSFNVMNQLLASGARRQNFYCPANPEQNVDGLWNFAPPNYRILGYAGTLPNTASLIASNQNSTLTPQSLHFGIVSFPPPPASTRVLVADVILTQGGQNVTSQKLTYTYTGIQGGYSKPHRTSHLDAFGRYPTGANVGMLDGHVEWRPFQNVQARTTGPVPGFWW